MISKNIGLEKIEYYIIKNLKLMTVYHVKKNNSMITD